MSCSSLPNTHILGLVRGACQHLLTRYKASPPDYVGSTTPRLRAPVGDTSRLALLVFRDWCFGPIHEFPFLLVSLALSLSVCVCVRVRESVCVFIGVREVRLEHGLFQQCLGSEFIF